jgi:hypothetical protein
LVSQINYTHKEGHAMGEAQGSKFEPDFNRCVKVEFSDHRITSNAGVLLLRDADFKLNLTSSITANMIDTRQASAIRYQLGDLLRERVYAMAMGYSAQDDVDRLAHDPAFRIAVWNRSGESVIDERLASQPTQSRLLTMMAAHRTNINALRDGLFQSIHRHIAATGNDKRVRHATIDLDSFPIEVHGKQPGSDYNGHYGCTAYHPLVASISVAGDYDSTRLGKRIGNGFIHAILRQGSAHTAKGAMRFVRTVMAKAQQMAYVTDFRMDAGYTVGAVMDAMNDQNLKFVGRLKTNNKLEELAAPHIYRPVGRPPSEGYEYHVELGTYQAESWKHAQRLILVVVDRPNPATGQLNLIPNHFFLVSNWSESQRTTEELLEHYRKRGTFEDRLGELNHAIGAHLSSRSFAENECTMLMALLAFNLAGIARNEHEDAYGSCMDLGRFQSQVLKAGALIIKHSRRLIVRVARSVQEFWVRLASRFSSWRLPDRLQSHIGPNRRALRPPPSHAHRTEVLRA